MTPTWTVRATVVRVVDGDTFDADLDLGWGIWVRRSPRRLGRVRLLGYDAPEMSTPEGKAAKLRAEVLLAVGSKVWVHSHEIDNFGRCLATVILDDGRNFVEEMLKPPVADPSDAV